MRRPHLAATLVTVVALSGPAVGATADDPTGGSDIVTSPVARAAFTALPAVYEMRVTRQVISLRTTTGVLRVGRDVTLEGAAFGVAPGLVVTARHLVEPLPQTVTRQLGIDNPTPAGSSVVLGPPTITLWNATTENLRLTQGPSPGEPESIMGSLDPANLSDAVTDLALVSIANRDAPTLRLDNDASDQPVALLGFGGTTESLAVPTIRFGRLQGLRPSAEDPTTSFVATDLPVLAGDSGAPAVGLDGRAHGIVLRRRTTTGATEIPAVLAQTDAVLTLLRRANARNDANASTTGFALGMRAFWERDYRVAAEMLSTVNTPLARFEQGRAEALTRADYALSGPSPRRRGILAIGVLAAALALITAVLRARITHGYRPDENVDWTNR